MLFLKYRVKLPISARKVDSQFLGSNLPLALDRKKTNKQTKIKLKIAKFVDIAGKGDNSKNLKWSRCGLFIY